MRLNPHDLSELLDRLGYYVDDETGEVMLEIDPCAQPNGNPSSSRAVSNQKKRTV